MSPLSLKFISIARSQIFNNCMLQGRISAIRSRQFGLVVLALNGYYIALWFCQPFRHGFPQALYINTIGLAAGIFITLAFERVLSAVAPEVRLMVATGFLGKLILFQLTV
jgi:hypothetical protein